MSAVGTTHPKKRLMKSYGTALLGLVVAGGSLTGLLTLTADAATNTVMSQHVSAHAINVTMPWGEINLPDAGAPVALSSPNVANLDGSPAIVVGDRAGNVYAYHLSNGSAVGGWPYHAGTPIDSPPSVSPGPGPNIVYVGVGSAVSGSPASGGYYAIAPSGATAWAQTAYNPASDPTRTAGVQAGMAVGDLGGTLTTTAGSLGQVQLAMNAASGAILPGWDPWFQGDSDFSTPAIADLYRNGQNEVIEGGDSTAGLAYQYPYGNGGHIRVLGANGNTGQAEPNEGLDCQLNTDEAVHSSPAVGEFFGSSTTVGIVTGTSSYYGNGTETDSVVATDGNCNDIWNTRLDGDTSSSPALADALGNGQLQVIEGTSMQESSGTVYVLNGYNGSVAWSAPASGAIIGSIVTADLTGDGYQDLIVPTTNGLQIFDGRSGAVVANLSQYRAFQSAPLVTNDPNGTIGITVAGYNSNNQGIIDHYEVAVANHASVYQTGAWPQFHHDPQLTGDAGTSVQLQVSCNAPANPVGYYEAASDGGIFSFGNLPFCGSTGAITLNQPVVAIAPTRTGGGYWMVARDGGIFSFGDAQDHTPALGSLPSLGVAVSNIVGMAPLPSDRGYYLVASDGGVFAFGSAKFYGSMGGQPLNAPIVGMAVTPDGGGYWMVAADGGMFAFGDAKFYGSMGGKPLDRPIVGMAAAGRGSGYYLVASDGGIFAFGTATFYGSMGGRPLNAPIVGMEVTPNGQGYRFVASDGGIFAFGQNTTSAPFYGSMGGKPLNRPIVGMAGF